MRISFAILGVFCLGAVGVLAQDQNEDSRVSVMNYRWERTRIIGEKTTNTVTAPVRAVIPENKNGPRTAREQQSQGVIDPNDYTIDGRSTALEKSVQESRSIRTKDVNAFRYSAQIRNDGARKIEIIFWEYRFKEYANPANIVRHQFLCSVKIKPGERFELSANSILAPSEVISTDSLTDSSAKLFDEKVMINRIEYADGAILQRRDWKTADVKSGLAKATSTPWGKEVCRPL